MTLTLNTGERIQVRGEETIIQPIGKKPFDIDDHETWESDRARLIFGIVSNAPGTRIAWHYPDTGWQERIVTSVN